MTNEELLQRYIDTGLEPEEIKEIIKVYNRDSTKAAHYEQLEEKGLLIKLPCKVKDTIYWVWCDSEGNPDSELEEECIKYFYVDGNKGIGIATDYYDGHIGHYVKDGELADNIRRIFLDKKEAEKALLEVKE